MRAHADYGAADESTFRPHLRPRGIAVAEYDNRPASGRVDSQFSSGIGYWHFLRAVGIERQGGDCLHVPAGRQRRRKASTVFGIERDAVLAYWTESVSVFCDFHAIYHYGVPVILPIEIDARIAGKSVLGWVRFTPLRFEIEVVDLLPRDHHAVVELREVLGSFRSAAEELMAVIEQAVKLRRLMPWLPRETPDG